MFEQIRIWMGHEEIYSQKEKSHHARPLMGMGNQIFFTRYLKEGPLAIKKEDKTILRQLNIGCLMRHGDKTVAHGKAERGLKVPKIPGS